MQEDVIKKVLPHSIEAEQSVLGSMLMNRTAISVAAEILSGDDFYLRRNGIVFDAMVELFNEGKAVDIVTLQDRLKEKNVPPEISDMDFIKEILGFATVSVNVKDYAQIVSSKALLRRVIEASEELTNECYADNAPATEIIEEGERKLFALFQKRNYGEIQPIHEVVYEAIEQIQIASRIRGNITGIPTGFADLDYMTSGLHGSELIIVAARPSMGKTALALNIAENMAFRKNYSVAIFSLEMSKGQLMNRLISMESSVDSQLIRTGNLKTEDWARVIDSADGIAKSKLMIDDTPGITVNEMRSKCRKYKLEHGLDVVIIDYLQLMSSAGTGKRIESRQQEVSEITRSLKGLARELNVPVVVLSQLSRAPDQRADHHPVPADLRESGSIEQDADVVLFIYRDDFYNHDSERKGIAEIIIAKQRNGPVGTVELAWLPQYTKFMSMERRPQESGG